MAFSGKVVRDGIFYCIVIIFEGEIIFLPYDTVIPSSDLIEILGTYACTIQDSEQFLF